MSDNNNVTKHPLLGRGLGRLRVGILGAAGYTGGELIRLLLNHPEAEIVFANSESNAGNLVSDVHEGLIGDTELKFTGEMPFDQVDVVFFCFGHGKSEAFLKEHTIPAKVKIIDLAQDFRIKREKVTLPYTFMHTIAVSPAEQQYWRFMTNPDGFYIDKAAKPGSSSTTDICAVGSDGQLTFG